MWSVSKAARSTSAGDANYRSPMATTDGPATLSTWRVLHTGSDLLTDNQRGPLDSMLSDDEHVEGAATWAK